MTLPSRHSAVFLLGPRRIEIRQVELPEPQPGEIVVRIEAATTCGTDVKVFRRGGHPRMLRPPCPFGHEMSGRVEAIGEQVSEWAIGDEVVVANSASCGRCGPCLAGRENLCRDLVYLNGAFAEFLHVPERFVRRSLYRRPAGTDAAVAALAEPLACVVHGTERMGIGPASTAPSEDALVLGGGPIGLMFVYLLAAAGWEVTLEDRHRDRLALGRRLGASHARPPAERNGGVGRGERYAATIDATGTATGWARALQAARPGAVVNLFGGLAPDTGLEIDATRLHYEEITLLGSYHHRPSTFQRALEILARSACPLGHLVSRRAPLEGLAAALDDMIARRALKVAIVPRSGKSPS